MWIAIRPSIIKGITESHPKSRSWDEAEGPVVEEGGVAVDLAAPLEEHPTRPEVETEDRKPGAVIDAGRPGTSDATAGHRVTN